MVFPTYCCLIKARLSVKVLPPNFINGSTSNKKRTTPYHPQCNGLTERFNRSFTEMLSRLTVSLKGTAEAKDWDQSLSGLLWAYRCHYHNDFKASPFYMLYGRQCHLPVAISVSYIDPRADHFKSRFEYIRELMVQLPTLWKFADECLNSIAKRYERINARHAKHWAVVYPLGTRLKTRY